MTRAQTERRIRELRHTAANMRQCAQRADDRTAYQEEMARAAAMDDEARRLEESLPKNCGCGK